MRAGATTFILPVTENIDNIEEYINNIDALLLTGGGDMDPQFWGEDPLPNSNLTPRFRDIYDLELYRAARRRCMPIMGICRGMQVMAIAEGGSLHQDIHACFDPKAINHSPQCDKTKPYHSVRLIDNEAFPFFCKNNTLEVNSIHHQSINYLPEIFSLSAVADDGVIEAFYAKHYPMFGVQWHPEHLADTMPEHMALFENLVKMAKTYRHARNIHRQSPVIDSHTDTPMAWKEDTILNDWQEDMMVDFAKMNSADLGATFMVAYLSQEMEQDKAFSDANKILARLKQQSIQSEIINLALSPQDITANHNKRKPSVVLAIENAWALNGNIKNVKHFYDMGVRYITLCHNGDNDVCDSAAGGISHNGISNFGKEVISEMNKLGIMIDISHAADSSMEQAIRLSSKPIIASHSGARAICAHRRNIPDNILRLIADNNGVCQICLYEYFLNDDAPRANVKDIISHIRHITDIAGIDHVGIGSDFDGGGGIKGCMGENEFINITHLLVNEGFSDDDIYKIMGGNFLRVWKENNNNQ